MQNSAAAIKMRFHSACANARTHKIAGRNLKQSKMAVAWAKQFKIKAIRRSDMRRFKTTNKDKYKLKALVKCMRQLQMKSPVYKRPDVNGDRSLTNNNNTMITHEHEHNKMAVANRSQQENEASGELRCNTQLYTTREIKMTDIRWGRRRQYRVKASVA